MQMYEISVEQITTSHTISLHLRSDGHHCVVNIEELER